MFLKQYYSLSVFAVLCAFALSGCVTTDDAAKGYQAEVEQVADVAPEPITRLSFVPVQNGQDNIKIVIHQGGDDLNAIMPALGEDNAEPLGYVVTPAL